MVNGDKVEFNTPHPINIKAESFIINLINTEHLQNDCSCMHEGQLNSV